MKNIHLTILLIILTSTLFSQGLENLGNNINTEKFGECYPAISPDGNTIYFSRKGHAYSKGDYDIFQSTRNKNGEWTKAEPMDQFNNKNKNVVYHISPDGNSIILLGKYGNNASTSGFSVTNKTKNGWSEPKDVIFKNEDSISWGNNACAISPNGNVMVISLSGDLNVSFKQDNDIWSLPTPLLGNINTDDNEYTPFLGLDNKTVYFSGGGHEGLGSNDIFKITRTDSTWLNWTEPENLGAPVNSSSWESFFRLSAKGDYAYVYSLSSGNGDLFQIKLKEENKPDPVVLIKGTVIDSKTNEPIKGAKIAYEILADGTAVGTAYSNPKTGEYSIVLSYGNNYSFSAKSEGYISISENMNLTEVSEYQEIKEDLFLTPIEVGSVVRLNNIFFDVAKTTLRAESYPELNKVVQLMLDNPNMEIEIGGHTDNDGSSQFNLTLSEGRAQAVMQYIIEKGIATERISSKGFGESKPVVENNSEENKQKNRRVEFTVTKN